MVSASYHVAGRPLVIGVEQPAPGRPRFLLENPTHLPGRLSGHTRHSGLDYPGFLRGNRREGVAKLRGVV